MGARSHNSSNNAKYLKFHGRKVECKKKKAILPIGDFPGEIVRLLIWRPGDLLESPGFSERVDSTAWLLVIKVS